MAYADSADLTARFDENVLKDLASDTGTPVTTLSTDVKITAALAGASGRINSALLVGTMYSVADLTALTGDDLAYLKDLTCELAMARLLKRRPEKYGDQYKAIIEMAEATLEMVRGGKNVFNIAANKKAGLPTIDGMSAVDYDRLNLIPDRIKNFYPSRTSRLPIGR